TTYSNRRNLCTFRTTLAPEDVSDGDLMTADAIAAKTSGHARGEVPIGCTHLTMFIDVQAKALFWLVVAWEADFTGYVIDYGTEPVPEVSASHRQIVPASATRETQRSERNRV
ncbi:MAG TPA: phage terminase large subunit family protein, partial [Phycisphaerae bacterium]|nr:phage terminase large subunit family protein [Phycisphaerae bacterium]HRR86879.1 phage terminase large subunit family protein [Phycisphaerae bacterium]